MTDLVVLLGVAVAALLFAMLTLAMSGPALLPILMALVSLAAGGFALARILVTVPMRQARAAIPAPPLPWRPLDQEEYAALLWHDGLRNAELFMEGRRPFDLICRRCGRRPKILSISHPIWEGPAVEGTGSGSGRVDTRTIRWCTTCDRGPLPSPSGPPVRLPYLDQLPIRLLPELYARAAFHELAVPVEPYVPPAPAPAEAAAPDKEILP